MSSKANRKPISNFFIKRSLQLRLIKKISIAALLSTVASTISLILVYYLKYQTVIVYQLDKITQELNREHIVYLILPTLLISALVSIIVAFCIGLYASRKYAVPIYKLEQWATLLRAGKISATLRFREKEEMKGLSDKCNQLAVEYKNRFLELQKQVALLKENNATTGIAEDLEKILINLELDHAPIEVNTGYYTVGSDTRHK